jgi:FOG: FHA domain
LKARQNPLSILETFIQRIVERPFNRLFPSKLEPVEIERKLERAMDENVMLQSEGRRLAPNSYDIYLSMKDHQQLSASQASLIRDWQNNLVEFARHRRYTLKTVPIIRLHSDTSLNVSEMRIDATQADAGEAGLMSTQALSAEQLAEIRAQVATNQQLPGIDNSQPNQQAYQAGTQQNNPNLGASSPQQGMLPGNAGYEQGYTPMQAAGNSGVNMVPMPQAWLTIRLPQAGQQNYRIEKPVVNIGRQLSNDIIVEDKRVSRYHAQIKYQDGQFAIYDLGSTNGITINNTPHMRQHTLRNGDHFTIGSYDFYFERR